MKILMVASEATPFAKTGGLADVIGSLPAALRDRGQEVAVVMPAYRENTYPSTPREVYRNLRIPLQNGFTADIFEVVERGVPFYFVDCPPLFDREGFYGTSAGDHPDNAVRFAVFCRAALDAVRHLFRPEVIHCHDWQSALLPVYMRHTLAGDPTFYGIDLLFTIHNLGYQGIFPASALPDIGLDPSVFTPDFLEFYGDVNLLKGAIAFSDAVSTVSRGYAREIQTPELGFGLDGFLRTRARRVTGIVNGVDYSEWSPETDRYIASNYSAGDLSGKHICKRALLDEFGLPADRMDYPLIGMVSRFVDQKGFDLITAAGPDLAAMELSIVALGSGDPIFEGAMQALAEARPDRIGVRIGYDNALAHRIEAGADIFLMPSRYEPCGLNQIYSLRYGTLPIVRATGGLDDTIDEETGFKFDEYTPEALLVSVRAALSAWENRAHWRAMMHRAMTRDFSWSASALEYISLYKRLRDQQHSKP